MKINIEKDVDRESFMVHEHILNGELVYLVQPKHIGAKWKNDNLHFRSSVWNYNGELISASFPKFFNWSEQPDLSPVPNSLKNATVVEKLDGSTLIVSKYNGQYILRTRGTVDASKLANGFELELFKSTILNKLQDNNDTWNYSIIWEWLSPINKIVLSYGDEPMWKLIGFIDHTDYSLATQDMLNLMAKKYDLLRPEIYTFTDISDMLQIVDKWQDKEGVCLYSKNDQVIHKIKASKYLLLHHLKSELSNIEKVLDVWLEQGMTDYQTFYNYIFTAFDYELAEQVKGMISRICDAKKEVDLIVSGMTDFVNNRLKNLPTRKLQAEQVISAYGNTNRAAFVFKILDNRPLGKEEYKKLLFQVLKN
jgi:hypothetical protein